MNFYVVRQGPRVTWAGRVPGMGAERCPHFQDLFEDALVHPLADSLPPWTGPTRAHPSCSRAHQPGLPGASRGPRTAGVLEWLGGMTGMG